MRISRTKYSSMTDSELLALADQQGLNLNELVRELMDRLAERNDAATITVSEIVDEQAKLF